jgi:hypothetical protein
MMPRLCSRNPIPKAIKMMGAVNDIVLPPFKGRAKAHALLLLAVLMKNSSMTASFYHDQGTEVTAQGMFASQP